jgi:hypothetical protein
MAVAGRDQGGGAHVKVERESARCAQVRKEGEADLGFNFIGLRGRENDSRVERPSKAVAGAGGFDGN